MNNHAQFHIIYNSQNRVLIEDLGPWDQCPTITNDVDFVLGDLFRTGRLQPWQTLLYVDSEGQTDQILHRNGKFAGFAPAPKDLPISP